MSTFGWDQMTDWWDENIGDEGDLWHRALIDPPLLRCIDIYYKMWYILFEIPFMYNIGKFNRGGI